MNKKNITLIISSIAIVLSISTIFMQIFVFAKDNESPDEQYQEMIKQHYQNFSAYIPDKVSFCGEEVPMDNVFVRESLDRELTYLTYQHASTFIVLKRAFRYFPEIEPILRENNVPEDLKFLAVAESALNNAVSPVKAEGFWQFMPVTAREFGLTVNDEYDERYDVKKSTFAACKYLRGGYSRLKDWALTCASYNCGERGVKDRMEEQSCDNYWSLQLNSETARYVYRIIAYKIIMENPKLYGFYIRKLDCYQPLNYTTITIDSSINNFYSFCKQINIPYKYFRFANPELQAKKLTNKEKKQYTLKIPTQESLSWKSLINKLDNPYDFL
ncbi:MAG: lytic transglycosylase domain-containing protein [Bacteroidales bacterium]|jgi:hypothetical protein|nr:lytic transglycosylase domain-containing protein [Bacteroidales bacterium]